MSGTRWATLADMVGSERPRSCALVHWLHNTNRVASPPPEKPPTGGLIPTGPAGDPLAAKNCSGAYCDCGNHGSAHVAQGGASSCGAGVESESTDNQWSLSPLAWVSLVLLPTGRFLSLPVKRRSVGLSAILAPATRT